MADYFTQEVVTEPVLLTPIMESVLELRDGEPYPHGDENVLDHVVNGVQACSFTVAFESGWNSQESEDLMEWSEMVLEDLPEEDRAEFDRLVKMKKHEFFHEVLKINPKLEHIELQAGWSCSKMRLDGFGGSSLYVTRKGYLYITTSDAEIDADGTVRLGSEFKAWEEINVEVA